MPLQSTRATPTLRKGFREEQRTLAALQPRMSVHLDANVDVVVATENIHFFDADTHEAIRS